MATPTLALSRLRIRVIGSQTAEPESPHPYTVYRTAVTYEGECYERLLRYSQFYSFYKKLKFKKPRAIKAPFPGRTWTRKAAFDDDLIEARQVLLNEFMKEVCSHDLSTQSQTHLMKLLRIGPYEDGSGRVSELLSSFHASYIKSDRGGSSKMDAILETLREEDKDIKDETIAVAHTATLTSTTFEFPAITSNATTVLADDERSILGSRQRLTSAEAAEMMNDQHARTNGPESNRPENRPRLQKATSLINATNGNHRPALKSSQSMPTSRRGSSRHVEFPADVASGHNVENDDEDQENIDPEDKYKHLIHDQLGSIRRLLSESETIDTDMSSTRSNHLALTA